MALALLAALTFLVPPAALAQDRAAPDDFEQGLQQLRLGNFEKAAEALEAAAKAHSRTDVGTQALYFAARAWQAAGDHNKAIGLYGTFLRSHNDHALAGKVRFRLADSLLALGRNADALDLLAGDSHRLTAPDRAHEIAARYVALADRFYDGIDEPDPLIPDRVVKHHNYPRAVELYRKAIEIGVADADSARVRTRYAQSLTNANQWPAAVQAWKPLRTDESLNAETRAEAAYQYAVAALRANQLDVAATGLLEVIEDARHAFHADALWEAAQLYARGGWDFEMSRKYSTQLLADHPRDPRAAAIRTWLAQQEAQRGENLKAAERFAEIVTLHSDNEDVAAMARIERARALSRAGRLDEATAAYQQYLGHHPNHSGVNTARAEIRALVLNRARRADAEARQHIDDTTRRDHAINAWGDFIEQYPTDGEVMNALSAIALLRENGGDFSGAIETLRRIAAQYRHRAAWALLNVARIYEEKLHQEALALVEYQRMRQQGMHDAGNIERLTNPQLELSTAGVVHSDAQPQIAVGSRNVKELICRAYKLDLLEFFRRKHETGNVQRLMVDVLRPDHGWTAEVPQYRDYRKLDYRVDAPMEGAGAWVMTVANESHRGTTLVLVSDLQLIVKNSPDQLLVLALNARTGAPWAGVSLLVVAGKSFEGVTGDDGVWTLNLDDLTPDQRGGVSNLTNAHIFASKDGHYAFRNFDPMNVPGFAFEPKAFAFASRSLYRAGETVDFKLMVRDVKSGGYALPTKGVKYRAKLQYNGRTLWEKVVDLSDNGTADGQLTLGNEAGAGRYMLHFESVTSGLPSTSARFEVREFERPEYEISGELDKIQYGWRDGAKLTLTARRYTGAPVANRMITVRVGFHQARYQPSETGAAWFVKDKDNTEHRIQGASTTHQLMTDADGKAELEFMPQPVSPPRGETYWVLVVDMNGQTELQQPVTAKAIAAISNTAAVARIAPRNESVKENEDVLLTVRSETVINTPVPLSGAVRFWKQDTAADLDAARAIRTVRVTIGESGRAEVRAKFAEAGKYVARFESEAGGETVIAICQFSVVSPDETEQRDLTVLSDRTDYFAGEQAQLTILSPVAVETALLTVEADKVLHWQQIRLPRGSSQLTLPVEPSWLPNVRISVTALSGERTMIGEREISARRLLQVKVTTDKAEYAPGDTVKVSITATDSLGRPVKAEVALAAIDESIFDLEPDRTGDIRAAFYNIVRKLAVRTGSSLGWKYAGQVAETDPDVMGDARTRDRAMARTAEALRENMERFRNEADDAEGESMADELRRMAPAEEPSPDPAGPPMDGANSQPPAYGRSAEQGGAGGQAYRRARGGGGRADLAALAFGETRDDFRLTAAWLPTITTDASGKATVEFQLPQSVASWRLTARGITAETQVGEATHSIKTKLEFYGEIDSPRLCVDGDRFAIGAQFVNESGKTAEVSVTLGEERRRTPGEAAPSLVEVKVDTDKANNLGVYPKDVLAALLAANMRVRPGAFMAGTEFESRAIVVGEDADALSGMRLEGAYGSRVALGQFATMRLLPGGPPAPASLTQETRHGDGAWLSTEFLAEQPGELDLLAAGTIGTRSDSLRRTVRVQPFGEPMQSGFSGRLQADGRASNRVHLPEGSVPYATHLSVQITPTLGDSLLDSLDYLREYPYGCIEQTVNRFFPALQVYIGLQDLQKYDPKLMKECLQIAEAGLARVLAHQSADGTWGWWPNSNGNPQLTALCYEALLTARRADLPVPDDAIQRARNWLLRMVQNRRASLDRAHASMLLALATPADERGLDQGMRNTLRALLVRQQAAAMQSSPDIAARMALAGLAIEQPMLVTGVINRLANSAIRKDGQAHWVAGTAERSYGGSNVETTALALRALAVNGSHDDLRADAIEWLESQKYGRKWRATRDTAMVIQAYVAQMQSTAINSATGTIKIIVNGQAVGEIRLGADANGIRNHSFELTGMGVLQPGANMVQLEGTTDARPRFHGSLRTVVEKREITARHGDGLRVERMYRSTFNSSELSALFRTRPDDALLDGSIAAEGENVRIDLEIQSATGRDEVMIEDPIPAGFEPVKETLRASGNAVTRFEHRPGKVVMFFDHLPSGTTRVRYECRAIRSGRYRALPTMVSMMYFPEVNAHGAGASFSVLTADEWKSRMEATVAFRALTLLHTARTAFAEGKLEDATNAWTSLLAINGLQPAIQQQGYQQLLLSALRRNQLDQARNHLQSLSKAGFQFPEMSISETVRAADAWRSAQPLQALAWYRSAISRFYDADRATADLATTQADRAKSLERILMTYPDNETLAADALAYAQAAAAAAPPAERAAVTVAVMQRLAAEMPVGYWNRIAMFTIAQTLFETGQHEKARDFGKQWLPALDTKTEPLADNIAYVVAVTSFAMGDYETAKTWASKLVETKYVSAPGNQGAGSRFHYHLPAEQIERWQRAGYDLFSWSELRPQAALMLAQLAHAEGRLEEAVKWYSECQGRFQDAQIALAELTREYLDVPAFVTAKPGEDAHLDVTGRNVEEATVAVYPFDLFYCFTVRKHLRDLHTIDLTGLSPEKELPVQLETAPYKRFTKRVAISDLEKGAYLVLVKSGDAVRSSIVIVSSLQAEARRINGALRVSVTREDGTPVAGAYVKVSNGSTIVANGRTDVRGIFQAGAGSVVLVERNGEYALIPDVK